MSPYSTNSIASFSFLVPASRPVLPEPSGDQSQCSITAQSTDQPGPPSDLALLSDTARHAVTRSVQPAGLLTLPTMVIYLIRSCLLDQESLQLLMTTKLLHNEVQGFYKQRLRPEQARCALSPIASYQNPSNVLPSVLGIGADIESTFQQCLVLKKSSLNETEFCSAVLQILKTALSQSPKPDNLAQISCGVTLGLGGTAITEKSRDALLGFILAQSQTANAGQMGVLMQGVCSGYGGPRIRPAHLHALTGKMLASYKTSAPWQMGAMVAGICYPFCGSSSVAKKNFSAVLQHILNATATSSAHQLEKMICALAYTRGAKNMPATDRDTIIEAILTGSPQNSFEKKMEMICGLCRALGGTDMTAVQCAGVLQKIMAHYETDRQSPLTTIGRVFFNMLGGRNMSQANLDAVLTQIIDSNETFQHHFWPIGIGSLCNVLGAPTMSALHRDTVLERVLGSHSTSSPGNMWRMIRSMLWSFNSGSSLFPATITYDYLDNVIGQIVNWYGMIGAEKTGAILGGLCSFVLNNPVGTVALRAVLIARIKESPHRQKIVAAIRQSQHGELAVKALYLEAEPTPAHCK